MKNENTRLVNIFRILLTTSSLCRQIYYTMIENTILIPANIFSSLVVDEI